MPNLGCLMGIAFQRQLSMLATTLAEAGLNLTPSEYVVMRVLYKQDGRQQCEIAEVLGKDKGAVSRCVATLARKGLVRTEPVSYKCLRVYVSDYGNELRPQVMDVARSRQEALAALCSPEELETFARVLKRMTQI